MKPPTIFHFITGLEIGGAEMALYNLLRALPAEERARHRVVSLTVPGPLGARIESLGVEVSSLEVARGRISFKAVFSARRMLLEARDWRIQGWMYHGNLLASVAAFLAGRPGAHIWTIHNSVQAISREKPLTRFIIRFSAFLSILPQAIVYVAERSAAQHADLGYSMRGQRIISNGADAELFHPDASASARFRQELNLGDAFVIGHVGRYDWAKDHANFIRALGELRRRGHVFKAVMAGAQIDSGNIDIMNLAREAGVLQDVLLLGRRDDMPQVMAGFDIFCLSSITESMPLVVVEAMLSGVPCVVTDVGDAAVIVNATGAVVPPSDPLALGAEMARFAGMLAEERAAYGRAARHRAAAAYSLAGMSHRYQSLYEEMGWKERP